MSNENVKTGVAGQTELGYIRIALQKQTEALHALTAAVVDLGQKVERGAKLQAGATLDAVTYAERCRAIPTTKEDWRNLSAQEMRENSMWWMEKLWASTEKEPKA